jgi:hypothetical protein
MPYTFPGALLPWIPGQFFDLEGVPLAGGSVQFYITGTTTPKDTYSQADRDPMSVHTNPVVLDADGRATIFLTSGGYDAIVYDSEDVELYTVEGFEDLALTFLESMGNILQDGTRDVTSGYTVLPTDNLVTVGSSGTTVVNLPTAASRSAVDNGNGLPLFIKNMGSGAVELEPNGVDTIDEASGTFTIPAASDPTYPSVMLLSDGVSNWWLVASHGLT